MMRVNLLRRDSDFGTMSEFLNQFRRHLRGLPLAKLESVRDAHKVSVGGAQKGELENEVGMDFMKAIQDEIAARNATALLDRGGRPVELISTQEKAPSTESRGRWSAAP